MNIFLPNVSKWRDFYNPYCTAFVSAVVSIPAVVVISAIVGVPAVDEVLTDIHVGAAVHADTSVPLLLLSLPLSNNPCWCRRLFCCCYLHCCCTVAAIPTVAGIPSASGVFAGVPLLPTSLLFFCTHCSFASLQQLVSQLLFLSLLLLANPSSYNLSRTKLSLISLII